MGKSPDEIRHEIEQTRTELGLDLDTLNEKINPARIAERRVDSARSAVAGVKDKVMGSTDDGNGVRGAASSVGDTGATISDAVSGAAGAVGERVQAAPQVAKARAQGNPLAAGVIAFGVGWLAASLLPVSQKEQQAAEQLSSKASELADPVKQQLAGAAQEVKDNLTPQVQQAAEQVKDAASSAASTVQEHAQNAATEVQGSAQGAASEVKETAQSSAAEVKDTAASSAAQVKDTAKDASNQ